MSKRGATQQLSKEGSFFGDGANQVSEDDRPKKATAAQMAARKLKPLKGRPRTAGTASSPVAQSFPAAQQSSTPFGGFGNAGSGSGFNFSTPQNSNFTFGASTGANPFTNAQNTSSNPSGSTGFSASFTFGANQAQNNPPQQGTNLFGSSVSTGQNNPPTFNFGGSQSASPGLNLFGTSAATSSTNMFGSASSAPPSNDIFSGTATAPSNSNVFVGTSTAPSNSNVFGGSSSASSGPSLFGTTSSAPSSSSIFSSSATSSAPSSNLFGNLTSSAPSSNVFGSGTSSTPQPTVFGSTTSTAPSKNLFGNSTSAASTPNPFAQSSTNLFSQSTPSAASQAGRNIFGFSTTNDASKPADSATARADSNTAEDVQQPSNMQPSTSTSIFTQPASGATSQSGTSLFGFSKQDSPKPSTSIFAQPTTNMNGGVSLDPAQDAEAKTDGQSTAPNNIFSQSTLSAPQPGGNIFAFSAQNPSKPIFSQSSNSVAANKQTDSTATSQRPADAQPNVFANIFSKSTLGTSQAASSPSAPTVTGPTQPPATSTTQNSAEKLDTPSTTKPMKASDAGVSDAFSPNSNPFPSLSSSTTAAATQRPVFSVNSSSTVPAGSFVNASVAAAQPSTLARPSSSTSGTGLDQTRVDANKAKPDTEEIRTMVRLCSLNTFLKEMVAQKPETSDLSKLCQFYLAQIEKIKTSSSFSRSTALSSGSSGLAIPNGVTSSPSILSPSKSSGKRKADDVSDNSTADGSSYKKVGTNGITGSSQTANIFSSIINKPAQSPLRGAENATSLENEAGPSNTNVFAVSTSAPYKLDDSISHSTSNPFKLGPSAGGSGSTTPVGSPAKPTFMFPVQSPLKSPSFGGTESTSKANSAADKSKRKPVDHSSDREDGSSESELQRETLQKTDVAGELQLPSSNSGALFSRSSTPGLSTGASVLNSRQPSPDVRNIFGHLSQDESNQEDDVEGTDDDEDGEDGDGEMEGETSVQDKIKKTGEAGSITPTSESKSLEGTGGLFGRITRDDKGIPLFGTPEEITKGTVTNPFGFPASTYDSPLGSKTGPVLKTWNGDAGSPIKFGSSQPAPSSSSTQEEATPVNPFANLAGVSASTASNTPFKFTGTAPLPANDSSPFKFNSIPVTPAGAGSVFSSVGSRATTPGLSTGVSENEASGAEDTQDEELAAEDKEQTGLRTALTDEDKDNYDILFDTDSKSVTLMRLVDRTEEELKKDPKKGPKKWESVCKGPIRVLKHKSAGGASILLKSEPVGRAVINTRLQSSFSYKRLKAKIVMFTMPDVDGKDKLWSPYIKFEDDADATRFAEVCESNKSS